MRYRSYFNTAVILIGKYDGMMPLVHYLKQYFAQHKKHGSKDRKHISHLCYCYYRIGHTAKTLPVEQRLHLALFLCQDAPGEWGVLFENDWVENWAPVLQSRIDFIRTSIPSFTITDIFPWENELSEGTNPELFALSHLIQPDLFLRIRPAREKAVVKKLMDANIPFKHLSANCLALPNASKIDALIDIDEEVVIQDYSSQKIADFLQLTMNDAGHTTRVWDCCAASGGKSILAKDVLGNIDLTVSDLRPSILQNLKQRFKRAGISNYRSFAADLSKPDHKPQTTNHKLIICDVPCTGSGTWGRTPEQLFHFSDDKIRDYAALQKKIIANVIPHLVVGGYFLYITCSVFQKENEAAVAFIQQQSSMELVKMELLKGYNNKADSMFAALFKKMDG